MFRHFTIFGAIAVSHYMCIDSLRCKLKANLAGIIAIYIVHWALRGKYNSTYSNYQKTHRGLILKLGALFPFDVKVQMIHHFESV